MRTPLIGAVSVLALLAGGVQAQTLNSTGRDNSTATTPTSPLNSDRSAQNSMSSTGTTSTTPATGTTQAAAARDMIGRNVLGSDGQKVGEVSDVILDGHGKATQLVVSSGGFLGIGDKKIGIDYSDAQWDAQDKTVKVSTLSRADVESRPEFKYSDTMTSLNRQSDTTSPGSGVTAPGPTGTGTGSSGAMSGSGTSSGTGTGTGQ